MCLPKRGTVYRESVCLPRKVICTAQSVCANGRETVPLKACVFAEGKLYDVKRAYVWKGDCMGAKKSLIFLEIFVLRLRARGL